MEHAKIMVKKRGGKFITISPAWSSVDAELIAKRLGVDKHTAPVYILTFRFLKSINAYLCL